MRWISWLNASEVSGPVATMVHFVPSSSWTSVVTSSRITRMLGSAAIAAAMRRENSTRSTASAWPAGTAVSSARRNSAEPPRRISCLSSQGAVLGDSLLSELEQTSSPNSVVWCAGVSRGWPSMMARIS